MRKIAAFTAAAILAFALAGCGSSSASSSAASSSEASASSSVASSAEASASSSSASSQAVTTVKMTEVKTADEAAKGAGIEKFGVFEDITLDGKDYRDPKFAYGEGVAQATYESGTNALILRKAEGTHTAPLTDLDKTSFAQTWSKSYEDLDVTCYGAAKGAATVITWADGTQEFGVTYQGQGSEDVSLDSDEVAEIVKAVKQANAKQEVKKEETKEEESKKEESDQNDDNGGEIGSTGADQLDGMDPEAIAQNEGLGEVLSTRQLQLNDGSWVWQVECRESDGSTATYDIDVNGNIVQVGSTPASEDDGMIGDEGADQLDGMDPEAIIQNEGLGEVVSTTQVQLEDGSWAWQVDCVDDDGDTSTYVIDVNGNISEG